MKTYQSKYNGSTILNHQVTEQHPNIKYKRMNILIPEDVLSILPADCILLTYTMVAALLHCSVHTLKNKVYAKEIVSTGTKPGTITLEEYRKYVKNLENKKINWIKPTNLRNTKNKQHQYSEEELNQLNQTILNPHNTVKPPSNDYPDTATIQSI